jgi:hypothetical protein
VLGCGGAGLLAALAAAYTDPAGRVLAGAAAVLLLGQALRAALTDPVLIADVAGVTVRPLWQARRLPWSGIASITARTGRRGLSVAWLEFDLGDELVTVPGWRLGVAAEELADELNRLAGSGREGVGP